MQRVIERRARKTNRTIEEVAQNYVASTALKRFVDANHIAEQAFLLASPASDSITGRVFTLDCGFAL